MIRRQVFKKLTKFTYELSEEARGWDDQLRSIKTID